MTAQQLEVIKRQIESMLKGSLETIEIKIGDIASSLTFGK